MPFEWRFAGGPIVAQNSMFSGLQLGIADQIPAIFEVNFDCIVHISYLFSY